ncbi:hypothetical protein BSL78_12776 [Apostichopus japonicus]|uniref:Uncharacterized protein n=1 Tax=Stichopus japonicus TaxID=307972 RepID=A0A2G8KQT6_STIJA|nr:hypothetical protein BSL78_12776 [Apostichopus japonicus]
MLFSQGFYAKLIASSTNMKSPTTITNHVTTRESPTVPITTGHCAADKMDSNHWAWHHDLSLPEYENWSDPSFKTCPSKTRVCCMVTVAAS